MLVHIPKDKMKAILDAVGGETRELEFKAGYEWQTSDSRITHIQAKTMKTILAMSNNPTGGTVVIGIKETGNSALEFIGVTPEQKQSFEDTEAIARMIDNISTGHIEIEIGSGVYNGIELVVLSIKEFRRTPNFASRDMLVNGRPMIIKYDLYVRANSAQPKTIKMTPDEFRDIVTMVEERDEVFIRRFVGGSQPEVDPKALGTEYEELDRDL